jgi:hypothetical protein
MIISARREFSPNLAMSDRREQADKTAHVVDGA